MDRLVELTSDLTPLNIPLSAIRELDEPFWYGQDGDIATCRSIALHAKLFNETELSYPIILSRNGRVMDGMHRVCKALTCGNRTIYAVQFKEDPVPDHVGIAPEDLSYEEVELGK